MLASLKSSVAALGLAVLVGSFPAEAVEWTRDTRGGGEITRNVTRDGAVYEGQTTRVGPNGATYTSRSTCLSGMVDRCRRSYSGIGPGGRVYRGDTATARGPYRTRSIGVHTGPRGRSVLGVRRHWR